MKLKEMLPKTKKANDSLILELIRKLLGQGSQVNITINNHIQKKLSEPKKTQDEGDSIMEPAPSVKAENFLPK